MASKRPRTRSPAPARPCSFFARNACLKGDRCRFSHAAPGVVPELALAELLWPQGERATASAEEALRPLLLASAEESGRAADLPESRRSAIAKAAAAVGLSIPAAFSLRRQMLRALAVADVFAERDLGSEAAAKLHATRFEDAIAAFLERRGVAFETEEALVSRAAGACLRACLLAFLSL